ncbi:MAG: toprim domain-containing protein [Rhodomicrobiaceae bacterium]
MTALAFDDLYRFCDGRAGKHDVACPICGPDRKAKANRVRPVLRVWLKPDGFATCICQRCGFKSYAHEGEAARISVRPPLRLVEKPEGDDTERNRRTANWLWRKSQPIKGTIAETYLRHRGITCDLPPTLRFLPPYKEHKPAMIAPFALPSEPEPRRLEIAASDVFSVHRTFLAPDGLGKAKVDEGQPDKKWLGSPGGLPIVLVPPNDGLNIAIGEGIETTLSFCGKWGIGGWAAGAAGHMPAIAQHIPDYIETITILREEGEAGEKHADHLAELLIPRGIEVLEATDYA